VSKLMYGQAKSIEGKQGKIQFEKETTIKYIIIKKRKKPTMANIEITNFVEVNVVDEDDDNDVNDDYYYNDNDDVAKRVFFNKS